MSQATLPARPNLPYLRKLAKDRLKARRRADPGAKLADAQLAVARDHGFASWRKLKAHVDALQRAEALSTPQLNIDDLMRAIVARDLSAVQSLLKSSPALANTSGPHPRWGGRPMPLHVAVETGDVPIAKALLDAGANPNADGAEYDRWTPLMLAAHWKHPNLIRVLTKRGAKVGLIEALMPGDDQQVQQLLKHDRNALAHPMPNDATPLHFVRTTKAARLLLDAGASLAALDKYGQTPADCAAKSNLGPRLLKMLLSDHSPKPWMLSATGNLPALKHVAQKNPSIIHDADVMKQAIRNGHLAIVRWLLQNGADPNTRGPDGDFTMLHIAAWDGKLAIARLLIEHGADPRAIDGHHKTTPAVWARHVFTNHNREEALAVAEYLEAVEHGGSS